MEEESVEKNRLRKEMLGRRSSLSLQAVIEKSNLIRKNLFALPQFGVAKVVMFYVAKDNEVRTGEMIKESLRMGKTVAVPITRVKERNLVPSLLTDYDLELAPGTYRILEPKEEYIRPILPQEIDLVIVPAVAFDHRGSRLGFGGGFYDNFLRQVPPKTIRIGLAFQLQMVEGLPSQEKDEGVNIIVTEEGVLILLTSRGEGDII
ncbi:5-formyltetrahydrofolate cyclo-ligase [bacterium]|nr:5-formyltetrahydrofolate cyclo-ligase [bacterium]